MGVEHDVELDADAHDDDIERLLSLVDDVAEIPRALRSGTTVIRRSAHRTATGGPS
jgi:hypothetical protein